MLDLIEEEMPSFANSVQKRRRYCLGIYRVKYLLAKGSYLRGLALLVVIYVRSPSRLWKTIVFRARKFIRL